MHDVLWGLAITIVAVVVFVVIIILLYRYPFDIWSDDEF